ncbi:MAG TPA: GNAT family N-acetyltransferase [Saprospiraceae bacterium]|nr:GNAT family N-acetyltransferase [Saprospiraceae bacterium]
MNVLLRPIIDEDRLFLIDVYRSTRIEELNRAIDWTEEQKTAFILHQFNAQDDYYKKVYPDASFDVIMYDNIPVGRLYVERFLLEGTIRIIDIAILPPYRRLGIGKYLINLLMKEASHLNKSITIHVEVFNKALELYKRLGFEIIKETNGVYYLMEWQKK